MNALVAPRGVDAENGARGTSFVPGFDRAVAAVAAEDVALVADVNFRAQAKQLLRQVKIERPVISAMATAPR